MLRLPSSAMRPHADLAECESPDASTSTGAEDQVDSESPRDSASCGRLSLVRRSKFFLQHEGGAEIHDVYEVESKPLGQGGFGTVWRARMRGQSEVVRAVKAVKKQSAATDEMVREEIAILRSLDHPYICRLFETFDGPKWTHLVMELIDGEELFDYIQNALGAHKLDENFAAHIIGQVFSALQYCHGRSVVHRDLKPENIMVQRVMQKSSGEVLEIKLIDFGLATLCTHDTRPASGSLIGTYCYAAPEACFRGFANPASDNWSAGMVLHTLLVGGMPRDGVCIGKEPLDLSDAAYAGLSRPAKELLAGLIRIDPCQRLTASQAGASPWLHEEVRAAASPERISKTMNAFTCFYRSNMLRRAVLTALAMQLADQQIVDLHEQFMLIDEDRNGRISRAELTRSINQACPGAHADVASWVDSVFESVDTDGSDEIEYTEWVAAAHHAGGARSDQAIHAAFRVFDVDGSGKISVSEIARITSDTPADIISLMPEYDQNGDGELDFEEFRDLILRAPPHLSPGVSGDSLQSKMGKSPAHLNAVSRSLRRFTVEPTARQGGEAADSALPRLCRSQTSGPVRPKIIVSM